jgi:succinyl-CoA synthetase beta subunit
LPSRAARRLAGAVAVKAQPRTTSRKAQAFVRFAASPDAAERAAAAILAE